MTLLNIGIPVSGLQAQATRLQGVASNIANAQSTSRVEQGQLVNTPYQPLDVNQTSLLTGGTLATLTPSAREALKAYDPSNPLANGEGYVDTPDVRVEEETVNRIRAKNAFSANLRVLQAQDDLAKQILDI